MVEHPGEYAARPATAAHRLQAIYDRLLSDVLHLDLPSLLRAVTQSAASLLEADRAYLTLWESSAGGLVVQASYAREAPGVLLAPPFPTAAWLQAFDGAVVQGCETVVLPDGEALPDHLAPVAATLEPRPATVVGLPLHLHERRLGTLTLVLTQRRALAPDELAAVAQLVTPAILALEHDRLQSSVRRQLREQEILIEGNQAMVGVLEAAELVQVLARHMVRVVGVSWCGVLVRQGDLFVLAAQARSSGDRGAAPLEGQGMANGVAHDAEVSLQSSFMLRRLLRSTRPELLPVDDTKGDPLLALIEGVHLGQVLACPLVFQSLVLGLALVSAPPGVDLSAVGGGRILWALGSQAACSLSNIQLLAEERRRSQEKALLLEAARLAASPLALAEGVDGFAELAARCLGVEKSAIYLFDRSAGRAPLAVGARVALAASAGFASLRGDALRLPPTLVLQGEGLIAQALASRLPRYTDLAPGSGAGPVERAFARVADIGSLLVWPFYAGEQPLGMLLLGPCSDARAHVFKFDLVDAVMRQLSVFIQNARLYDEVRLRAERMKAMADITDAINMTLDVNAIFNTVVRSMRKLVPADHTSLGVLARNRGQIQFLVTSQGQDGTTQPAQIYRLAGSLAQKAVQGGRVVLCEDLRSVPRTDMESHWLACGMRSVVLVPLKVERQVRAVLVLGYRQVAGITSEQVEVLEEMAGHLATALHNADMVEEIRQINDELRRKDAVKSDFFSMVAHDLRTPLTILKGYLYVLLHSEESRSFSSDLRETLETMDSEADHLRELIENLISLAHLEAIRGTDLPLQRRVCVLSDLVSEVLVNFRGLARKHQVQLEADVPLDLQWPVDRGLLVRALYNLLGNALKFTRDGRVALRVEERGEELLCSVADTGPGIEPEHLERIFERFFHVDEVGSNKVHGTGLGLAIVASIASAHGGRVWVESELGKGTTFWFTLRAAGGSDLNE